jgi:hypothetical protein
MSTKSGRNERVIDMQESNAMKKKNECDGRRQTVFNQPLAVENVQVAFYIRHTHRLRQLPAVKTVVTGMNFPFAGALAVAEDRSLVWSDYNRC